MENISNNKKRRLGRPAKHTAHDYKQFAKMRARTPRGKQNYIFAQSAISVLHQMSKKVEAFKFLLQPKLKTVILGELGRIDDQAIMLGAAYKICSLRMPTEEAVGYIRDLRRVDKEDWYSLGMRIFNLITKHRKLHPSLTDEDIKRALSLASPEPGSSK